jgi:hypothetical protein
MAGDNVTIEPAEAIDRHAGPIVRGRYGGTDEKSNLRDELIASNYISVWDGTIVSPALIREQASESHQTAE